MKYRLRRSGRKSVLLSVDPYTAEVVVRAPRRMLVKKIEEFIHAKEDWLLKQKCKVKRNLQTFRREFVEGEEFPFLGKMYKLRFVGERSEPLVVDGDFQMVDTYKGSGEEKKVFAKWYREQAESWLPGRVANLAEKFHLEYKSLRVGSAKWRLGSCGASGEITLTWKLILYKPEIIDYVITHELAHLVHHNHSRAFWDLVASMDPDFKEHKRHLKANPITLFW